MGYPAISRITRRVRRLSDVLAGRAGKVILGASERVESFLPGRLFWVCLGASSLPRRESSGVGSAGRACSAAGSPAPGPSLFREPFFRERVGSGRPGGTRDGRDPRGPVRAPGSCPGRRSRGPGGVNGPGGIVRSGAGPAVRPADALPGRSAPADCPNLPQRPRSSRSAREESLIFRAFLRGRSRRGTPLWQIWTRPRPDSPQEPHPPHADTFRIIFPTPPRDPSR